MSLWPDGVDLAVYDTIDSTNEEARRRARDGEAQPVWIVSKQQTAGRGRHGRVWTSPPGNMAATHLFRFEGDPPRAATLSFVAALAVADTLAALAPDADIGLKWPNDALLNGKKTAGILLESFGSGADGRLLMAIGIGLNLLHHPPREETNWAPTSVLAETGQAPDFDQAIVTLAARMAHWMTIHTKDGMAAIRPAWIERTIHRDRPIEVRLPSGTITGRFNDLDVEGNLVLEDGQGITRIAAGDVFFPGAR